MAQPRVRRKHNPLSSRSQLQTVVNDVKIDRQTECIHAADVEVVAPARQKTRSSNRAALPSNAEKVAISSIFFEPIVKGVGSGKIGAKHDPTVLHDSTRPEEHGSDHTDIGRGYPAKHFLQPEPVKRRTFAPRPSIEARYSSVSDDVESLSTTRISQCRLRSVGCSELMQA